MTLYYVKPYMYVGLVSKCEFSIGWMSRKTLFCKKGIGGQIWIGKLPWLELELFFKNLKVFLLRLWPNYFICYKALFIEYFGAEVWIFSWFKVGLNFRCRMLGFRRRSWCADWFEFVRRFRGEISLRWLYIMLNYKYMLV